MRSWGVLAALTCTWLVSLSCGSRTELDVVGGDHGGGDSGVSTSAVLFGGYELADTWTWDGTAWTLMNVTGPPQRDNAMMAPLDGKVVLFGGAQSDPTGGASTSLADTWTWDGISWVQVNVTGPPARSAAMMASLDGKLVLFGGNPGLLQPDALLSDTWTFDGTAWEQVNVTGPPARMWGMMAPLDGKLVLYGGSDQDLEAFSDVWAWDGTVWTNLPAGPPGRVSGVMAALGDKLVLFGGLAHDGPLSDTWTWDGATWTQLDVTGPVARSDSVMTPAFGKLVLFGGEDANVVPHADTWTWDGAVWMQLDITGPSARLATVMATP